MKMRAVWGQAGAKTAHQAAPPQVPLRILASSDLHANLLAWDYHAQCPAPQRGLAQLATLIARARAEAPQNLLLDNGDFLHGTDLGDFLAKASATERAAHRLPGLHPMIAAMNRLRYDAVTLGNHEFSHGLAFLRRSLSRAAFPIVCSNLVFRPSRGRALAQPYLLLDRILQDSHGASHPLRIGILGFLPPQTMIWEQQALAGFASVDDIVAAAKVLIPDLRRAGADLIIALSHSGIGCAAAGAGAENASSALAELSGIDVVIAGHTHQVFPEDEDGRLAGKPAVLPGFFGSHLGVIDLVLRPSGQGLRLTQARAVLRPIAGRDPASGAMQALVGEDPAIAELARQAHQVVLSRAQAVIAHSPIPLHSYFALVTETPAQRLVAEAQAQRLREVLAGGPHADLPVLSAVAPFKAGGRGGPENYTAIAAGPLRQHHVGDLYQHPNTLTALWIRGAELRLWLERAASLFSQIPPGARDASLIDAAFPCFNFDSILGLEWQVDLTRPAAFDAAGRRIGPEGRIVGLRHGGKPLTDDQVFALATNSYRSAGGAGFAGTQPARILHDDKSLIRDLVAAHLRAGHGVDPALTPSWRFLPQPGTTVTFDSAPAAARHLAEVPHLHIEPLALQPSGFRRFRLHL